MIRIAVCDDTIEYTQQTVDLLEQWSLKRGIAIKTDCFDNGDSLLNALATQPYDIVFLDIIMPMFSGIDTCAEIRKENRHIKIIFLSVSPEFGVDAFRVKANGYLLKPLEPSKLFELMDEHLSENDEDSDFLIVKSTSMVRKVPLNTICYVEAQNKHILLYTSDNTILTLTMPLHQLVPQLNFPHFFQCHRSYIVNMNYIRSHCKNELIMHNGCTIPISRNIAKEFHDVYFTFLFGKAGDL